MFRPLSDPVSYGLLTAFLIFLLQERVSQHVPALVRAGLLLSLNRFHNIYTSGAGFSTCSDPCRNRNHMVTKQLS
jgi:hypothetical protein